MSSKPRPFEYSTDNEAGITRRVRGDGFAFFRPNGKPLTSESDQKRIASLVIPPAWTDVWISPNPRGHLQATGRDARGRKQYRYHPAWIAERDSNKYESLPDFARVLPRIRRAVVRDLRLPALCKERVLAAIVRLMDQAFIRVGGERYRRENGSFGATTLRNRHVRKSGDAVVLDFRGKSGKRHQIRIDDGRVVRVIRRCLELPGDVLFQYKESDELRSITAADVNAYLKAISGADDVSSKDFRTWGGTVHAARYLADAERGESKAVDRAHVREAIKAASQALGNTPAVCRKSYIHPRIFECFESGVVAAGKPVRGLRADERMALALLTAKLPTTSELLERSVRRARERAEAVAA